MLEEADKYGLFKVGHVWILSDDILAVKHSKQIKNGLFEHIFLSFSVTRMNAPFNLKKEF
jgi:hypothetical protein